MIFSLQKYWRVEYELPVANALASMIANEDDQAIMEACAETIGNAYGENTPKETQARLRELLYGTLDGKIGVVMRIENLIYDRHKGTFSNLDDSHSINERDWTKDPHYNLRIFYIGESVRKNWENLEEANFENASLPFILLYQADAKRANFRGTDMRGGRIFETHFDNAKMDKVNLRGADLTGAHFESAGLESAYFNPPDSKDIAREPKQIDGTQLDHTKLTGAHFVGATLNKADFTKADLTGADLTDAHLLDTVMTDANLEGAIVREDELAKIKGKYKGKPKFIK